MGSRERVEWHPETGGRGERSRLFFGLPEQVDHAVAFADEVCDGYPCHEAARQIVYELAANAIAHTRSSQPDGWFVVRIVPLREKTRVTVFDQGHPTNTPTLLYGTSDSEHGHGLRLVAALAQDWRVEGDTRSRSVWADLPGYLTNDPTDTTTTTTNSATGVLMPTPLATAQARLAARVSARCDQLGLNQLDLAARAGQHHSYIHRIEHAQTNPTLGMLLALAGALEMDLAELVADLTLPQDRQQLRKPREG